MPETELPQGRYLSCVFQAAPHAGGQTRALLMRNRIFAREGVRPDVLTFGATNDHHERREILLERGLLVEGMGWRNIYEHYLEHGWGDRPATGEPLADLGRYRTGEKFRPDGSPWRVTYRVPGARYPVYDYLRADGSPYLRIPAFGLTKGGRGRDTIWQVGPDGRVVGQFASAAQWFRRWIRELTEGAERAFVFIDSRHVVPQLVPMRSRHIHLIYLMHNMHLHPPYRWDSETNKVYRRVLNRIGGLDAMVTLTQRQGEDIAERRGRTSNLFVVPNPVELPAAPAGAVRDPNRVAIVARLEGQKRLHEAIAAFEQVTRAVPAARLDIFGEGSQRERLQAAIDGAGLAGNVTLHGFHPEARDALWTASAFMLTSRFEGHPLSVLESMSRGCPVVSYDIKYGPREQITDGVDGFLVPAGDRDALARRVVELLRSPELVERMSAAARERASRCGPQQFVADWAAVLRSAVEQRRRRTQITGVELDLTRRRLRWGRLQLAGTLRVELRRPRALKAADVQLAAIDAASGAVTELPLKVERRDGALRFRTPGGVLGPRLPDGARLRLRCIWRNSAWETELPVSALSGPSRTAASGRARA
jgi:poly(glycerol-phosphate) alpha-glucosyltransferase